MFFTWVPGLRIHALSQYIKSMVLLLLMIGICISLPLILSFVHTSIVGHNESYAVFTLFINWGWIILFPLALWNGSKKHDLYTDHRIQLARLGNHKSTERDFSDLLGRTSLSSRLCTLVSSHSMHGINAQILPDSHTGLCYAVFTPKAWALTYKKTESILAHELGHLVNGDHLTFRLKAIINSTIEIYNSAAYLTSIVSIIVLTFTLSWTTEALLYLLAMCGLLLYTNGIYIVAIFAHSRAREYLADVSGLKLLNGDGATLAKTLAETQTEKEQESLPNILLLLEENGLLPCRRFIENLISAHPPPEKRIRILEQGSKIKL